MYGHRGLPESEQTVTTTLWVAVLPRWMQSPLAALAFRAQKQREAQDVARHPLLSFERSIVRLIIVWFAHGFRQDLNGPYRTWRLEHADF